MIYFYYGTDIEKARQKSLELIQSLLKRKPDASLFKIDSEHFDVNIIKEYIEGQGLFSEKYIVFFDKICEKKETKEIFLDLIKEISESKNIFVIFEGKLDKVTSNKIEKKSEKFINFQLLEKEKKSEYNAFALADAFANKNKKESWILYRKAIDAGEAPEALHGMIFWKVKSMILESRNSLWKKEELNSVLKELIDIYHESRRGESELETRLESFILL